VFTKAKSIKRHLDYTSARLRRAVKVSFAFTDQQTDLKAEKTAVFALIRLRNSAVYLFSAIVLSVYRLFCTPKCASHSLYRRFPCRNTLI
jgi:hypothetical protein